MSAPRIVLGFSWRRAKVISDRLPGTDEMNAPECCCCGSALPAMALLDDAGKWWGRTCYRRAAGLPVIDRSEAARERKALRGGAAWVLKWSDRRGMLPNAILMRPHSLGWDWVWPNGRRAEGGGVSDEQAALLDASMVIATAIEIIAARDEKEQRNQAVVDEHGEHMYGSMVWPPRRRVRLENVRGEALKVVAVAEALS